MLGQDIINSSYESHSDHCAESDFEGSGTSAGTIVGRETPSRKIDDRRRNERSQRYKVIATYMEILLAQCFQVASFIGFPIRRTVHKCSSPESDAFM